MCGIAGYFDRSLKADTQTVNNMLTRIHHRGTDEYGIYTDDNIGIGSVKLRTKNIAEDQQPMSNEKSNLWIVCDGEVFNNTELRNELERKGHIFKTESDTEVIIHLYEEYGEKCLPMLNGQFAFIIWDNNKRELFMARDQIGIRPLFYYHSTNLFVFGSEIKAIFEHPKVSRSISAEGINETFTFWSTITPSTVFENIKECPPGHFIKVNNRQIEVNKYWQLAFATKENYFQGSLEDAVATFDLLFYDAVKIRMKTDVPVAAYLSGGIDSSIIAAYMKKINPGILKTFSVGFADKEFDESHFQNIVSKYFSTNHNGIRCTTKEIAENFPKVVWYSETPLLRTSPSPMYSLSKLVHDDNMKVVITGEGADELLAGYNIFKENKIRHFWSKFPNSKIRPLLLRKLYPYIPALQGTNLNILRMFYAYKLEETSSPIYSHLLRWKNTSNINKHLSSQMLEKLSSFDPYSNLLKNLNGNLDNLDPLAKAQYIEMSVFLSGYLLSSQGDRVGMANSVEGRYPFLDHRIIEFCISLPPDYKLKGLNEKALLKTLMKGKLPDEILNRPKQAYRAPIVSCFFGNDAPGYVKEVLSPEALLEANIFDPNSVSRLMNKMNSAKTYSEIDSMAITAIISTQLLYKQFIKEFEHLSIN